MKKFLKLLLIFLLVCGELFLVYNYSHNQNNQVIEEPISEPVKPEEEKIKEDGYYYSKEDVALYIHTYNRLPVNFITKNEARKKVIRLPSRIYGRYWMAIVWVEMSLPTEKELCQRKKAEPTMNVTSIMMARSEMRKGSSILMMV